MARKGKSKQQGNKAPKGAGGGQATVNSQRGQALNQQRAMNRALQQQLALTTGSQGHNTGVPSKGGPLNTREKALMWNNLGRTENGRHWAFNALHPCAENSTAPDGIPDSTQGSVATPEYRTTSQISIPSAFATGNWDLQIVVPPIPEIDYIWRAKPSGVLMWHTWNAVHVTNFLPRADGTANTLSSGGFSRYRFQNRGVTCHLRANATQDQGMVIYGQFDSVEDDYQTVAAQTVIVAGSSDNPTFTQLKLPSTPQRLVTLAPKSGEMEAREGCYLPLRFRDPVHLYKDAASGAAIQYAATDPGNTPATWLQIRSSPDGTAPEQQNSIVNDGLTPTFTAPTSTVSATQMAWGCS
jgi:hypothetical protein